MQITAKTKKREEALHQRVDNLEERNKKLENAILQMMESKEKRTNRLMNTRIVKMNCFINTTRCIIK